MFVIAYLKRLRVPAQQLGGVPRARLHNLLVHTQKLGGN